jgi:O-acetyl-ADP-ribose deacetylase (regulator of RNase III)
MQKDGKLSLGEVFLSPAGKLKADFIVHVVAPIWKGGTNNEESLLEDVVIKSLRKADNKDATSIAFPAISCGGYG